MTGGQLRFTFAQLSRTSLLLLAIVLAKVGGLFFVFKQLSSEYGVEGFGLLSQAMAVGALFSVFAGGGNHHGIVKEVAACTNVEEQVGWMRAAFSISLWSFFALLLVSITMFMTVGEIVFGTTNFAWVFVVIGVSQIGTSLGNTSSAYLVGVGALGQYAFAGIAGSILASLLVVAGSRLGGLEGAIVGAALFSLPPAMLSLAIVGVRHHTLLRMCAQAIQSSDRIKLLLRYSFAMILAAIVVPIVLVLMRSALSRELGWQEVGQWQSVARIGDAYMQFFGLMLSSVLLPTISAVPSANRWIHTRKFAFAVFSMYAVGAVILFSLGAAILELLYNSEFRSAEDYIFPQLVADMLKLLAALFVYQHLANGRPLMQAYGEYIQAIAMAVLFFGVMPSNGMSAAWAYVGGAGAALCFYVVIEFKSLRMMKICDEE